MKTRLIFLLTVAVATFTAAQKSRTAPRIAPWGFDLAGMDRTVKPGEDFVRYVSGTWMRNTTIPPDQSSWSTFSMLRTGAEADVKAIVDDVVREPHAAGSIEQKITDLYRSYLDTATIEAAGLTPVMADLSSIAAARTHADVARLMGRPDLAVGGPLSITQWPDAANPDRYAINIVQSGLTLPDRDYYLASDARFVDVRGQYRAYIEALLALGRYPEPARAADSVLAIETAIARLHWTREKRADRDLTYHPKSQTELKGYAPDYPWDAALEAMEISKHNFFVLKEDEAIRDLTRLFTATSVETWRAYTSFRYLNGMADLLPLAFDDLSFAFNGRALLGQPAKRERWKRATTALNATLGEAVGQLYVQRHFTRQAKATISSLVEDLRAAFKTRINSLTWMSPPTKAEALRKLAGLRIKVGYPDVWRDYSKLEVRPGDPVGNRKRSLVWNWRRQIARLNGTTDREEWGMTPQTVNAYYNSFFNEIVFPAAILQAPYFDADADPAVNYGGIGAVIGHEMGHAFDDQGSKTDGRGAQRNWWSEADANRFKALTSRISEQYSHYEALPGVYVNGRTTLSENLGDGGGLSIALAAYHLSLHGKRAPVQSGFTGDQRFFLSYAQTFRENIREGQLRANLTSDPHSPAEFRVNGVVRNMDEWYIAFGVRTNDALYLAPKDRVRIW
ncbi:MAG TPA: M13 family metallopeptidase [Thermoanaerobaculia bacterium]|jgi:predicted metalloendopeptidase|nr:M13 family metallopeptidase [Thermoanaerobaculia bacterium]